MNDFLFYYYYFFNPFILYIVQSHVVDHVDHYPFLNEIKFCVDILNILIKEPETNY